MPHVLHGPIEIAGQMGALCAGLQARGWKAHGLNWFHTYLNYDSPVLETDAFELLHNFEEVVRHVDIVHFHNADTMIPDYWDLEMIRSLGKKMVMHHWGNDVRDVDLVNARDPRWPLPPSYYTAAEIADRLVHISRYIDTAIIQDVELYPYVKPYYKKIFVLPLVIDTQRFTPVYPSSEQTCPLIVHAPTDPEFKGTKYIEEALSRLSSQVVFAYQRIEGLNHAEATAWYRKADIVIDQVIVGTYGMLAVEAMALGKPVVARLQEGVRRNLPSLLPVVHADPERLERVLDILIRNAPLRRSLGQKSRAYAMAYHSQEFVIPRLMDIYAQL